MPHPLALSAALLLLGMPAEARQNATAEVYRVTERGGGLGVWIDQTVTFTTLGGGRWIAERAREESNWCGKHPSASSCAATKTKTRDKFDGQSCPQLAEALQALSVIPLPSFADPDAAKAVVVADASLLTVEGWPRAAGPAGALPWQQRISISEYSGPFRAWWTRTEADLKPCWLPFPQPS